MESVWNRIFHSLMCDCCEKVVKKIELTLLTYNEVHLRKKIIRYIYIYNSHCIIFHIRYILIFSFFFTSNTCIKKFYNHIYSNEIKFLKILKFEYRF